MFPRELANSGTDTVRPSACPTFLMARVTSANDIPSAGLSVNVYP